MSFNKEDNTISSLKQRVVVLSALLLVVNIGYCQEWIRYFGIGQKATATYCLEHYDKGYILSGTNSDLKYGWLVKTDINGYELWNIKIGDGVQHTTLRNVELTDDNGLITCGSTRLFTGSQRPFILKLNPCGESEWCRVINLNSIQSGSLAVKPTKDGGYALLGIYSGTDRICLFKFNGEGAMTWHKVFEPDSLVYNDYGRSLYVDSLNFLITAYCYYPNWMKPYFIQTDTAGNETWRLVFSQHTGLSYVGDAFASIRDLYGNYYSAGMRDYHPELLKISGQGMEISQVDLFPSSTAGGAQTIMQYSQNELILGAGWVINSINYLGLVKTDTAGIVLDTFLVNNPINIHPKATAKVSDNKILFIGTEYIGTNSRIILFKLQSDFSYDTIYSNPLNYDNLCSNAINSQTITPSCDVITGLEEPLDTPENITMRLFPNPAVESVRIEFPKTLVVNTEGPGMKVKTVYHTWRSVLLEAYDITGRKVLSREVVRSQGTADVAVSEWEPGIYLFRLIYNDRKVGQVTFVKK